MRAYIHAFQGKPWNEECETAYRGFKKLGIECILFTAKEELDKRSPNDIVVSDILIMGHVLTQMGIQISEYKHLSTEAEIICSDVKNFVSEWRCFICYGEILDIRHYAGNFDVKCDRWIV